MMANKKFKLNDIKCDENVLKRDSFSDRICDQLFQLLFSYLSFEDKIRFECVSKQFQRLIFNKQNVLESSEYSFGRKSKNSLNQLFKARDQRMDKFVIVLQKCKFINNIDINVNERSRRLFLIDSQSIINKIIYYCSRLKSISFNFNQINEKLLIKFGKKFGRNLLNINFRKPDPKFNEKYKTLLRYCVNLVSINDKLDYTSGIDLKAFVDRNELLLPKLTKAMINCRSDGIEVETFVKNYKNTLKSIDFSAIRDSGQNSIMKNISQLKSLEELKLNFRIKTKDLFINSIKAIANECKQIKSLQLILFKNEVSLDYDLLNLMQSFKQLKRLDLRVFYERKQMSDERIKINLLNDCKQLIHLRISSENIDDDFYEDIDLHLPQLIYLNIGAKKIKNKALKLISKLRNLKTFVIGSITASCLPQINDSAICYLINNCPQIESIIFKSRPDLTKKTIDALIELALKKPRIQFKHYFLYLESGPHYSECKNNKKYTAIQLQYYNIPENLSFLNEWVED